MNIERPSTFSSITPLGEFVIEHWRHNKIINCYRIPNGVTNEGKNKQLNINFFNDTQPINWWMGLIDSTGFIGLAATDTYQNINQVGNGWIEFTAYTDPDNGDSAVSRPLWRNNEASGPIIANTTQTLFTITNSGNVKGMFLVGGPSSYIKNDNSAGNILWATALFVDGDGIVIPTDQLKATYTITV